MILLKDNDFECVGVMAKHCDLSKVCVAEDEAISFDLMELFCGSWEDILAIWIEVDAYLAALAACTIDPDCERVPVPNDYATKYALIYGGFYEACGGKKIKSEGVKKMLVYYAYSRYIIINGFNDTPNGMVSKNNEFSIPKSGKELESFSEKYRNMGYTSFKRIRGFICNNTGLVESFTDCPTCTCGGGCKGGTINKGFGLKSRVIKKGY